MCKWLPGRDLCSVCGKAPPTAAPASPPDMLLQPRSGKGIEEWILALPFQIVSFDWLSVVDLEVMGYHPETDQLDLLTQEGTSPGGSLYQRAAVGARWKLQPVRELEELVCGAEQEEEEATATDQDDVKGSVDDPASSLILKTSPLLEKGESHGVLINI